ncbi:MAG: universal stress protein [Acidobacteria bacterium]|nr:universal stress protein [Acidobacteriota bacterium]
MRIFHPTDFSPASDVAFVHALKLALGGGGSFTVFHFAGGDPDDDTREFPHVRDTLARWGLLPPNSPREDVASLGVHVRKVAVGGDDPTDAILKYLEKHPADLIVLGTHQRSGAARWLDREVALPVARTAAVPALFVPPDVEGFVNAATGAARITRIVLPIDAHPHPRPALELLPGLVEAVQDDAVSVELVHVGTDITAPHVRLPEVAGWTWETRVAAGDPVEEILRAALKADLLVLTTEGRHGFLDALRGSTTERIVRGARCPVLAIPSTTPA